MAGDYLDLDMGIVYDSKGNELKATPYFENYLYNIISTLGGEGSNIIGDVINTVIAADKVEYMFALVKTLKKQIDEISNTIDSPILDAKVKSMQAKLSELEAHFDNHQLQAAIKQLKIDTAKFIPKIKTSNYSAINKDWVEARSGITVSLPANAVRDDEVIVSNGDGSTITVSGNGNNIKYTVTDTSITTHKQGTSLHFHYFIDAAEEYWRIQ